MSWRYDSSSTKKDSTVKAIGDLNVSETSLESLETFMMISTSGKVSTTLNKLLEV